MNPIRSLEGPLTVSPPEPPLTARLAQAAAVPFGVLLGELLDAAKLSQPAKAVSGMESSSADDESAKVDEVGDGTDELESTDERASDKVDESEDTSDSAEKDDAQAELEAQSSAAVAQQGELVLEVLPEQTATKLTGVATSDASTPGAQASTPQTGPQQAAASQVATGQATVAEATGQQSVKGQALDLAQQAKGGEVGQQTEQQGTIEKQPDAAKTAAPRGELFGKAKPDPAPNFKPTTEASAPRPELFVREEGTEYQARPIAELPETHPTQRPELVQGATRSEGQTSGQPLSQQAAGDPGLSIQLQVAGEGTRRSLQQQQQQRQGQPAKQGVTSVRAAEQPVQSSKSDALAQATGRRVQRGQSTAAQATRQTAQPRQAEMIDRIVRMARVTRSNDTSTALIRLKPAELGEVKIELTVREGVVHGKLEVESIAARNLLEGHLAELRGSLADEGLEIGRFEVNVRDGGEGPQQRLSSDRSGGTEGDPSAEQGEDDGSEQDTPTGSGHEGSIDFLA